jgi:hypothetical protein
VKQVLQVHLAVSYDSDAQTCVKQRMASAALATYGCTSLLTALVAYPFWRFQQTHPLRFSMSRFKLLAYSNMVRAWFHEHSNNCGSKLAAVVCCVKDNIIGFISPNR